MTHFRKRLDAATLNQINEWIAVEGAKQVDEHDDDDKKSGGKPTTKRATTQKKSNGDDPNQGTLVLDASCAPADIAYPTDLTLLNEAREKMESIIDTLHASQTEKSPKPRTYREKARKAYLLVAKQRKAGIQKIRKAIGKQLKFVARDLRIIEKWVSEKGLEALS